jgi:hypothetical protein
MKDCLLYNMNMAKPAATNVPMTAGCWMDASLGADVGNGVADGIMEDDMEGIADDHEDQADEAVESTRQNVELDMLQVLGMAQRHARKKTILTAGHHHRVRSPGSGCSHG